VYDYIVKFPAEATPEEIIAFWGDPGIRILVNVPWIDERWRADITGSLTLPFFELTVDQGH
jgi:hypothetical protein